MSDLVRADAWMHMVFSYNTPLNVCERTFREFSLEADFFVRREIADRIIPEAEKRGDKAGVEACGKILAVLERVIAEKK